MASLSSAGICFLDQAEAGDAGLVGGKVVGLHALVRAGLPVPPGFCITSQALAQVDHSLAEGQSELATAIQAAYRTLGAATVAVRSSAAVEDATGASAAGQLLTILDVEGEAALLNAIDRCRESLGSAPVRVYRRRLGIADSNPGMAVLVQRQVPSDAAGVMFTTDPDDAAGRRMLVEASWGFGEAVVSSRVTPDRFVVERLTGHIIEQNIGKKSVMAVGAEWRDVELDRQLAPSLTAALVAELAELGRRVEASCSGPRDVEWAWADGQFWLLQARPITTPGAVEREQVRQEEISRLRKLAAPEGTVWSRFNLAETLPAPTPMTWSVVQRLLSGRGGLGLMYRDLGFDPDPALDDLSIYDLIGGRPYCNLSREPRLHYHRLPFEHPMAALKANPAKALYPRPVLNPARGGLSFWCFLPFTAWRLFRSAVHISRVSRSFADELRTRVLPQYLEALNRESAIDVANESPAQLLEHLERVLRLTLVDFARDSLKSTALAGLAMGNLERSFARTLGSERSRILMNDLVAGIRPEPAADLAGAFDLLARGKLSTVEFLKQFGHRGPQEMELSEPRWNEEANAIAQWSRTQNVEPNRAPIDPDVRWQSAVAVARVPVRLQNALATDFQALRTYIGLRETAKHNLMHGYALIRQLLLEIDARAIGTGGVFYLTLEELPRLLEGQDFVPLIAARRRRRIVSLAIETPPVIFSDDLEAIGRPITVDCAISFQGIPLSAGVAEGSALVLRDPAAGIPPPHTYVLVCPSAEPALVPYFVRAKALVTETGGVLSHGAIVAREFGIPAVAGLPSIHRTLRTGQQIRVDGNTGRILVRDDS